MRGRMHARSMLWFLCAGLLTAANGYAAEFNPPTLHSEGGAWPIRRQWTFDETKHYAKWIGHVFEMKTQGTREQRLAKLERVLTDPEMNLLLDPEFAGEGTNPQLDVGIMRTMHNVIDCGKLTVALPAYYSYRRALPWMVSYVRSADGGDVRTASHTIPVGTLDTLSSPSPQHFFTTAVYGFCTGNYRVEPVGRGAELSDTVPVAINPQYLMPGCTAYCEGHALILAKIDPYGELYFLDASTVSTRDLFTHNGMNCVVGITPKRTGAGREYAGCYRGLRVYRYPLCETAKDGKVIRVRRRTDAEMAQFGYSTEQYERMEELVTAKRITETGVTMDSFNDLIRFRMKSVDKVAPVQFMRQYADGLLEMYRMREESVQATWNEVQAHGPIVFPEKRHPENIFNANGRWGEWSSCAADVDRRNKYAYLAAWMDDVIRWYERMPQYVDLSGLERYTIVSKGDLAQALTREKTRVFHERAMEYTNSAGKKVRLTLLDIERRIYDLSFDPNQPPELRWGAQPGTAEFATAKEMATPLPDGTSMPMLEAYRLETFYRTLGIKETDASYMREICTRGFAYPDRFNEQLAKWYIWNRPADVPPLIAVYEGGKVPEHGRKATTGKSKRGSRFQRRNA